MTTEPSAAERPLTEPGRTLVSNFSGTSSVAIEVRRLVFAIEAAVLADARARVEALVSHECFAEVGDDERFISRTEALEALGGAR